MCPRMFAHVGRGKGVGQQASDSDGKFGKGRKRQEMWDTPATRHEGTEEPELTSPRSLDGILREAGDRGVRDGLRAGKKGAEKAQES